MTDLRVITNRLRWEIGVQLERPSNYGRRVTVGSDDVLALIEEVEGEDHE